MSDTAGLPPLILIKIEEQIERLVHLARQLPSGGAPLLDWRPTLPHELPAMSLGELLHHLLDCLAGFGAVLQAVHPENRRPMADLQAQLASPPASVTDFQARLQTSAAHIATGFASLTNDDLERAIPTVFVPQGEAVLSLLLGNFEHLVNHKFQLFFYLKLLGVAVGTPDLYVLRG